MSSIIEESKKAKSRGFLSLFSNKKIIISLVMIIVVAVGAYFVKSKKSNTTTQVSSVKEWSVKVDDIVVAVDSEGQVVAEDGVELSFGVSDDNLEVKEVYVKEGDTVQKGDKIALADTDSLELSLNSAWTSYQSALADYNETMDGASDDDIQDAKDSIKSAEISLEQTKLSIENTKQSAEDSIYNAEQNVKDAKERMDDNKDVETSEDVKDAYRSLVDQIKAINLQFDGDLPESDDILGIDDKTINDEFEDNLGAKKVTSLSNAKASYIIVRDNKEGLDAEVVGLTYSSSYTKIDKLADLANDLLESMEKHLYDMQVMLKASIISSDLTQNELDGFISTINSNRSSNNSKISSLDTAIENVSDAKDSIDDYVEDYEETLRDLENTKADSERNIASAESNLVSKELSLEKAKRALEELTAPLTEAELASARSRLTSASVSLQKARNELDKATIISPIDGEIVQLNYKVGDIIVDDNEPVAVILNSETLFIKVNVEEADVSDLKVGQKAVAVFDALDELELEGEISFISLTSETSNNGIVTYEVRVLINNPSEKQIREGMTASIEFVSAEARDVLTIPVSAVRNVNGSPSVQLKATGGWTKVTTGFTDGKYVEVISGINEGDTLLY